MNWEKVVEKRNETKFKCGDGDVVSSFKSIVTPEQIDNSEIMIDAISNELPLLLSKDAMKKANTTTDFMNDKVNILGQGIGIGFTNSGHYSSQSP